MIRRPALITCLISDGSLSPENFNACKSTFLSRIQIAVNAGVSIVQIREKQLSTRMLFDLAAEVARIIKGSETLLLINDRADVAAAAGANGVHLTGTSLGTDQIRRTFGDRFVAIDPITFLPNQLTIEGHPSRGEKRKAPEAAGVGRGGLDDAQAELGDRVRAARQFPGETPWIRVQAHHQQGILGDPGAVQLVGEVHERIGRSVQLRGCRGRAAVAACASAVAPPTGAPIAGASVGASATGAAVGGVVVVGATATTVGIVASQPQQPAAQTPSFNPVLFPL